MTKIAVIILSDPKQGTEESLGRLFNGLAVAVDAKQRGYDIAVLFQGTGTRWPALITQTSHPANGLYEAVKDKIVGVSSACADVFGARESAREAGCDLVSEYKIPGTSGLPSISHRLADDYRVVIF